MRLLNNFFQRPIFRYKWKIELHDISTVSNRKKNWIIRYLILFDWLFIWRTEFIAYVFDQGNLHKSSIKFVSNFIEMYSLRVAYEYLRTLLLCSPRSDYLKFILIVRNNKVNRINGFNCRILKGYRLRQPTDMFATHWFILSSLSIFLNVHCSQYKTFIRNERNILLRRRRALEFPEGSNMVVCLYWIWMID